MLELCKLLLREVRSALAAARWGRYPCLKLGFCFSFQFAGGHVSEFGASPFNFQVNLALPRADLTQHRSQVPAVPPQLPLCRAWQEKVSTAVTQVKASPPPLIFLLRPWCLRKLVVLMEFWYKDLGGCFCASG